VRNIEIAYKDPLTKKVGELNGYVHIREFVEKYSPHKMTQVRAQIANHREQLETRGVIVYFGKRVLINPQLWLEALKDGLFRVH
jgi:hypothetical protein